MVLQELFARLGFKVDEASVNKAKAALKEVHGVATTVAHGIAKVAAVGGAAMTAFGAAAVNASMQMETLRTEFGVLLQDVQKGADLFEKVHQMAIATPFDDKTLAKSAKTLLAYGVAGEEVMQTLTMLGDVAGADSTKMQYLSLVYGQVMNAGRLKGDDLRQMVNWGVNPLGEIAKKRGISYSEATELMSQRQISAAEVAEAFRTMTSEGGRFFGNLEAQSKTFQGRFNRMKGTLFNFMTMVGDNLTPVIMELMDTISTMDFEPFIDWFRELGYWLSELKEYIHGAEGASNIPYILDDIKARLLPLYEWLQRIGAVLRIIAPLILAAFGPKLVHMMQTELITAVNGVKAAYDGIVGVIKAMKFESEASFATMTKGLFGVIGLAFTAAMAFKELQNHFKSDAEKGLRKMEVEDFRERGYGDVAQGMDAETSMQMAYDDLSKARERYDEARRKGNIKKIRSALSDLQATQAHMSDAEQLFYEAFGVRWHPMDRGNKNEFSELRKSLDDLKSEIGGNTRATKDNTRSITKVNFGNSAFDTRFNMQVKDAVIAAYST